MIPSDMNEQFFVVWHLRDVLPEKLVKTQKRNFMDFGFSKISKKISRTNFRGIPGTFREHSGNWFIVCRLIQYFTPFTVVTVREHSGNIPGTNSEDANHRF